MGVLPTTVKQRLSQRATPSTLRRSVRLPELALGMTLVVAGATGSVLWATRGPDQRVLVAARDLHRGELVGSASLRWAAISGDHLVGMTDPSALIGRMLAGDVRAGTPVVPGDFRAAEQMGPGEVGFGVALQRGAYPPDLAEGDRVQLVITRSADSSGGSTETEVLGSTARVQRIDHADESMDGRVVLGLIVQQDDVVVLAAADRIHLVRVDLGTQRG